MDFKIIIYLINLDGSDERLKTATTCLSHQGIDFRRISAFDGRKIDPVGYPEYDEVKADKIILALPFYTRKWKVNSNGELVEKPSVVSMLNIKIPNGVEKQWNEDLQQYYIEYADGKDTVKMWIEDGTSITSKVSLVSKYGLAGTSGWRKDMETSNVWTIINTELQKASN